MNLADLERLEQQVTALNELFETRIIPAALLHSQNLKSIAKSTEMWALLAGTAPMVVETKVSPNPLQVPSIGTRLDPSPDPRKRHSGLKLPKLSTSSKREDTPSDSTPLLPSLHTTIF